MESFRIFINRVSFTCSILLVIALLLLVPAMSMAIVLLGAASAITVAGVTAWQVMVAGPVRLDLPRHKSLSVPVFIDHSGESASSRDEDWPAAPPMPAAAAAENGDDPPSRWARRLDWLNDLAEKSQPAVEPVYRPYLLAQAWTDLAITLVESWDRLHILLSRARENSKRKLKGKNRDALLFPVRASIVLATWTVAAAGVLVSLVAAIISATLLALAVVIWIGIVVGTRASDSTVTRVRRRWIICPHPDCSRKVDQPSYECRACEERHSMLKPNQYGAMWHTCRCGARLPSAMLLGRWRLTAYCPFSECGKELPPRAGRSPIRHIPILGASQAGKTTLSCLMMRDLRRNVSGAGGSLEFTHHRDEERLGIVGNCMAVRKTTPMAGLMPIMANLHQPGRREDALLYCFDPAGEDITGQDALARHPGIWHMSAGLVAIDPFAIQGEAGAAANVLGSLIQIFIELESAAPRIGQRGRDSRIKRFAVVVTKADLIGPEQGRHYLDACHPDVLGWLVESGLGSQVAELKQHVDEVVFAASGLPARCPCTDFGALTLWVGDLTDNPWPHSEKDCRCAGNLREPVDLGFPTVPAAPAPPELGQNRIGGPEGRATAASGFRGLPRSYRIGRRTLLPLSVVSLACSWIVILDVIVRAFIAIIP